MPIGSSPYLQNSDPALVNLDAGSFTIAFWLKVNDVTEINPVTILLAPDYKVTLNADATLTFLIKNFTSNNTYSVSSAAIIPGWNLVVLLYDLTNKIISLDVNNVFTQSNFVDVASAVDGEFTSSFQLGTNDRMDGGSTSSDFGLDSVSVWGRLLSTPELTILWGQGVGASYPFLGGPFNMIFEGNLINDDEKPVVAATSNSIWNIAPTFDSDAQKFLATLTPLFSGSTISLGFNWRAENFSDKIIFAQRDNRAQYWTPPLPAVCQDLPGLPTSDAKWDGVTVFKDHVLLWRDDRLKWSDIDDFTTFIPVVQTAISAVLTLATNFIQPAPGGNVSVSISNPLGLVKSVSLVGPLVFPSTNVGDTATLLLNIENTGTDVLNVTGISLPSGFSGSFSGTIPVNGSVPVLITFAPTDAIDYEGVLTVASDATSGTTTLPISGTGIGSTKIIQLGGFLNFLRVGLSFSLTSALTITNNGNATLNISSITAPTDFSVGSFPSTVAPGATANVIITFHPTASIVRDGNIVVTSDATAGSGVILVQGTGLSGSFTPTDPRVFITDLGTLQFGAQPVGSPITGTLRIENKTSATLTVVGITLPTGFSGSFSGGIAAFSHHDVTITFNPTSAIDFSGSIFVSTLGAGGHPDTVNITVTGSGQATGKVISLDGTNLVFGNTPVGGNIQGLLEISNVGTVTLNVSSITLPSGFSGAFSGSIAPGATKLVIITFSPTAATTYSGTVDVISDATVSPITTPITGTGFVPSTNAPVVAGQFLSLTDVRSGVTYYNFYQVVSATSDSLVLTLQDLTGATPAGLTMPADGRQFFTLDANEAGETRIVGAQQNGPIFRVVPQGDYAYCYKERSIQSIQYTGLGNGTFFIHNEIYGEGLLSRDAFADRQDGTMVFLGHREMYVYQGGPIITPVCQQFTRQLYKELDRSRLTEIRMFHNESRHEIWLSYPIVGGFRVLIWNYVEDSASIDDYDPSVEFTALGQVDWSSDITWGQLADSSLWNTQADNLTWNSLESGGIDHATVICSQDGNLRMHGLVYTRDGNPYVSTSESMDYDFEQPDMFKYVDVVVVGLDVKVTDNTPRTMYVQIGAQDSLSGADIRWTAPQPIIVSGQQQPPVKVNPGGSGRYLRVRFTSSDPNVQWRVSSFEIHCRPGNTY